MLGAAETITLHGVNAASLTAADFVFNQTPVVENAGTMAVSDGAMLPLGGIIDNTGTIALNSTGDATDLQIIGDGITLQGGGQVTMSGHADHRWHDFGHYADERRQRHLRRRPDRHRRRGNLTLVNEAHGARSTPISPGGTLTLDTGHTITNDGVLEATNGGTLRSTIL